jgi:hypothetical protein
MYSVYYNIEKDTLNACSCLNDERQDTTMIASCLRKYIDIFSRVNPNEAVDEYYKKMKALCKKETQAVIPDDKFTQSEVNHDDEKILDSAVNKPPEQIEDEEEEEDGASSLIAIKCKPSHPFKVNKSDFTEPDNDLVFWASNVPKDKIPALISSFEKDINAYERAEEDLIRNIRANTDFAPHNLGGMYKMYSDRSGEYNEDLLLSIKYEEKLGEVITSKSISNRLAESIVLAIKRSAIPKGVEYENLDYTVELDITIPDDVSFSYGGYMKTVSVATMDGKKFAIKRGKVNIKEFGVLMAEEYKREFTESKMNISELNVKVSKNKGQKDVSVKLDLKIEKLLLRDYYFYRDKAEYTKKKIEALEQRLKE